MYIIIHLEITHVEHQVKRNSPRSVQYQCNYNLITVLLPNRPHGFLLHISELWQGVRQIDGENLRLVIFKTSHHLISHAHSVCTTIDLPPLLTPLPSRREKTSDSPPKKPLSTVKSQRRWKTASLNRLSEKELQGEKSREECSWWTTKDKKLFFLPIWLKLFQIQPVPTLNYKIWLICGLPQCCTM